MNILVTNDDGIEALGIQALVLALSKMGDVYVSAPDGQMSACGHGITMHSPLIVKEWEMKGAKEAWRISGTPADCVKVGVKKLAPKIDIVFSGTNHGSNLGTDTFYSGTVGGAVEGVFCGLPAVAVSICSHEPEFFEGAQDIAQLVCRNMMENGLNTGTMLNVNVPNVPKEEILGVKITKLGVMKYDELFKLNKTPFGAQYYWFGGELIKDKQDDDTDIEAIRAKHISITPLHFDLTSYKEMEALNRWKFHV